jgi:hypothetical protein
MENTVDENLTSEQVSAKRRRVSEQARHFGFFQKLLIRKEKVGKKRSLDFSKNMFFSTSCASPRTSVLN